MGGVVQIELRSCTADNVCQMLVTHGVTLNEADARLAKADVSYVEYGH